MKIPAVPSNDGDYFYFAVLKSFPFSITLSTIEKMPGAATGIRHMKNGSRYWAFASHRTYTAAPTMKMHGNSNWTD